MENDLKFLQKIKNCHNIDDILDLLQSEKEDKFTTFENNFFLINKSDRLEPVSTFRNSENLKLGIQNFEENGVIDWIVNNNQFSIIPNLNNQNYALKLNFLILPFNFFNKTTGIYAALTNIVQESIDPQLKSQIQNIFDITSISIFALNLKNNYDILTKRLEDINSKLIHTSQVASIGEITSSISMELAGPINIMNANLDLLETGIGDFERRVQIIRTQLDSLNLISSKLSSFSYLGDSNKMKQEDLGAILDDVVLIIMNQLNEHGIKIEKEYQKGNYYIKCIKTQIEQVVLNLLINAKEAMQDGGSIKIGVYPNGTNKVTINISDNGIGIADEDIDRVFEPFYSSKIDSKKSGLGLFYCKNIIKNHKGKIFISSILGNGTTVKLMLSLAK